MIILLEQVTFDKISLLICLTKLNKKGVACFLGVVIILVFQLDIVGVVLNKNSLKSNNCLTKGYL